MCTKFTAGAVIILSLFALLGTPGGLAALGGYSGAYNGFYLPVGVNAGTSSQFGAHIGGELSIVYMYDLRSTARTLTSFTGVYADYLFSKGACRASFGIEAGIYPLIFDVGYLYLDMNNSVYRGFVARLTTILFPPMPVMPYLRFGKIDNNEEINTFIEFGVLAKFPVSTH